MHLIELMDRVPLWLVGLIVMIVAQTYAIGLMLLTRSIFGVSRLAENNEVAGFKFAVVGVFYAVLLAFVVVAVWEEYRNNEAAVRNEAKDGRRSPPRQLRTAPGGWGRYSPAPPHLHRPRPEI